MSKIVPHDVLGHRRNGIELLRHSDAGRKTGCICLTPLFISLTGPVHLPSMSSQPLLPVEVVGEVTSWLRCDIRDLLAFSLVTRGFRYVVLPYLFHTVNISTPDELEGWDELFASNPYLLSLIRNYQFSGRTLGELDLTEEQCSIISSWLQRGRPSLHTLHLVDVTEYSTNLHTVDKLAAYFNHIRLEDIRCGDEMLGALFPLGQGWKSIAALNVHYTPSEHARLSTSFPDAGCKSLNIEATFLGALRNKGGSEWWNFLAGLEFLVLDAKKSGTSSDYLAHCRKLKSLAVLYAPFGKRSPTGKIVV